MTTAELVAEVKEALNRPADDDLFDSPGDFHEALTRAQRHFVQKVAVHYPDLVREDATLTSADGGDTYVLPDDHFGELDVWEPPGPPDGRLLEPSLPESGRFGYWQQGRTIHLTSTKDFNPLHIRWIPATQVVDAVNDPSLPEYFREAYIFRAAYELAKKPGYLSEDPRFFKRLAINEWSGDPEDDSDTGIIGMLKNQQAYQGLEGVPTFDPRWYRFT